MGSVDAGSLFLSAIVVPELEIGVIPTERRDVRQGAPVRAWLDEHVLPSIGGRIRPVDMAVA